MPLHRRVPKRGFNNIFRTEYDVVNLDQLEALFDTGATVTVGRAARARHRQQPHARSIKVLGRGEVTKALTVQAHKFSGKAAEKLAAAGGKAEAIAVSVRRREVRGEVRGHEATVLDTLKNLFAVADLRNRVLFTLGMLAVYRVGNHIPTPGRELGGAARCSPSRRRTRCSACTTCSRAAACRRSRSSRSA